MATSNRIRALNRLPFDFQDGLKVGGVDVTALNQTFTPAGAGLVGFTPVGNLSAGNVQAALAELESEKVGFARLDDTDGSSLVGYDGGTVQDVMDSAKPMADYTALRAYTGRATSVRITSNGIAGFFYRDDADTASADNGGTIIVSGNGKRWKRLYDDAVNVKWFGAKGNGADDDTSTIQVAIDYCKLKLTTVNNSNNGGHATLYFPQGAYLVSGTLNVSGVVGFRIVGEGKRTTNIIFIGSSSSLFYYSSSIYCNFERLTFSTGTVSYVGSVAQLTAPVSKTNTCFKFNGNGGGTEFIYRDCHFTYWDKVFTTIDSAVNDDCHRHYNCSFISNNTLWDNTNTQAVEWIFEDCKVFSTASVIFKNPGADLHVRGGDFINPGTFLESTLTSTGIDSSFTGLRFENYQNIDPASSPKLLILSGSHSNLLFDKCTARGGGTLTGKTYAILSGSFQVTLRNCLSFSGTWDINADNTVNGVTSLLTLDNSIITINQTTFATQGYRPININYVNYPNSGNGRINRYFRGALGSQTLPITAAPMVDAVTFQSAVNASTITRAIPVFVQQPYSLILSKVKFVVINNTPTTFDLVVWKDSTKAVKLCEITGMSANAAYKVFESLTIVWPIFTSTSDPMFIEVLSAGNAGTVQGHITFEFQQTF